MWSFSRILLPVYLASQVWAADRDFIKPVCEAVDGVVGCKTFDYPSSAVRKTCNSGGSTVTCGITIVYTKVNWCTAIKQAMAAGGEYFVSKAPAVCGNLAYLRQFAEAENNYRMWTYGDLAVGSHPVMLDTMKVFERNLLDADIPITDSRKNSIQTNLVPFDGWKFERAADYDLARYTAFLKAIRPCWDGFCDRAKLAAVVADFYDDSDGVTDGEFRRVLSSWITLFKTIKTQLATVKSAATTVQSRLKTVNNKVAAVKKSACVGSACKGKTAAAYLTQVSKALTAVSGLKNIGKDVDWAVYHTDATLDLVYQAIDYISFKPTDEELVRLVLDKKVTDAYDIMNFFRIGTEMPAIATRLKTHTKEVDDVIKYRTKRDSASKLVAATLTKNWKTNTELSKTAALRKVRDGFTSIQAETKKQLNDPLLKLANALKALDSSFSKFQLRKNTLEWRTDAARYKRYTVTSFDVPCVTIKKNAWTLGDYYAEASYPAISGCSYGPEVNYFPNAFIPYIAWRFVKV